jgi:hypothetical protein
LALLALRAVERTRPVAASHGEAGAAGARSARGSKDAEAEKNKKGAKPQMKAGKSPIGEPGFSRQMGTSVLQIVIWVHPRRNPVSAFISFFHFLEIVNLSFFLSLF